MNRELREPLAEIRSADPASLSARARNQAASYASAA